jgi:AcrR family transcriptional regulator
MPQDQQATTIRTPHHRTVIGQAQKIKKRAWIIQCAIPVFAEHGPDAPVVDDFARAAGISRGTFYNYFQTTRELLDATMAMLSDELIAAIVPLVRDEANPVVRLATAARMYYRRTTIDPAFRDFLSSVSGVGTLAMAHARTDLLQAIRMKVITVDDIDLAESIAFGIMVFALRSSVVKNYSDDHAKKVVRSILMALGATPELITKALAVRLPD